MNILLLIEKIRKICDKVNYPLRILEKYLSENFSSDIIFWLINLSSFLSINQVFKEKRDIKN